jgi:SPP1 family predicted phage head-tail adaptor
MRASELRHFIVFQSRDTGQDTSGQQMVTWTDAFSTWAKIEPLSGRELFAAHGVNSEVTHRITTRYRAEFAVPSDIAAMRVVFNGRFFNLHPSTTMEERNLEVQVMATEGMNDG